MQLEQNKSFNFQQLLQSKLDITHCMVLAHSFRKRNSQYINNLISIDKFLAPSFLLSLSYKQRKYCFWVKFSKWRFWWIYTFWGPLITKITFLAFGLCVCVSVCVSMCVSVISITDLVNISENVHKLQL